MNDLLPGFSVGAQKRKVELNIKRYGREYLFTRYVRNEFKETTDEVEKEITIRGIYHMSTSHIKLKEADGSRIVSKRTPMLLVLYDDFVEDPLETDDKVDVNGSPHRVTEAVNLAEGDFAYSVSLELIV